MCRPWTRWLAWAGAAPRAGSRWGGLDLLVSARVESPVNIRSIEPVEVRKTRDPEAVAVLCVEGAGSNAGYESPLDLDHPDAGLTISQFESDQAPVKVPPGQFRVDAGQVESLRLHPAGTPGAFFSFRLKIAFVSDGRRSQVTLDDGGRPYEFAVVADTAPIVLRPGT